MQISIIKIGGNVIDFPEKLDEFLALFAKFPGHKILIHGGGVLASRFGESMGVMPEMVDGRRITDKDTLDIVTMVYAGLINKNILLIPFKKIKSVMEASAIPAKRAP
jgi:acetylglutamate kinase